MPIRDKVDQQDSIATSHNHAYASEFSECMRQSASGTTDEHKIHRDLVIRSIKKIHHYDNLLRKLKEGSKEFGEFID